jgi:hypothetical protein
MNRSGGNKKECNTIFLFEIMGVKLQTQKIDMLQNEVKIKLTVYVMLN